MWKWAVFVAVSAAVIAVDDPKHFVGDEHNVKFDHNAFLGADEAKKFDELTPTESRQRLKEIVKKIDENSDGYVTLEELKDWINYTQKRYVKRDVDTHWKQSNPSDNETIAWETYRKLVYGFIDTMSPDEIESGFEGKSYRKMIDKERRRWIAADLDRDDALNKTEFFSFLHPEESAHMRDLIAVETIEEMDQNNDEKIDVDEYISDLYRPQSQDEEEPDWVKNEKLQFSQYRDKDKDGYLTLEEVRQWILPSNFDHALAEAQHLLYEADTDKDNQLSLDEILNQYDLFVGSQATDFGEMMTAKHDEL
uniref:Reticulocalbin-3 n=1 Tax=Cuerna arida TaxID=1464854 RepID=A0A1B6GHD6_9HEMI